MLIDGAAVWLPSPQRAREFRHRDALSGLTVVPDPSVAENLFLARQPRRFGLIDWATIRRESIDLLERAGLRVDSATPVHELDIGQRHLVELARALDLDAKVLVLDPPVVLTGPEVTQISSCQARAGGVHPGRTRRTREPDTRGFGRV